MVKKIISVADWLAKGITVRPTSNAAVPFFIIPAFCRSDAAGGQTPWGGRPRCPTSTVIRRFAERRGQA